MPGPTIFITLSQHPAGLTVAELLAQHMDIPRRSLQRMLAAAFAEGQVQASGNARARRYTVTAAPPQVSTQTRRTSKAAKTTAFPAFIPLSTGSAEILAYVDRPQASRTPVGYQREFLDSYRPNKTWYLSAPLRSQLRRMGTTEVSRRAAGTHGRAIFDRLLIDLSWASSHLEGNTYSRLDTRELIERGKAARGKAALETQMILNHKTAIELLVENAGTAKFDPFTLRNLHSCLAENLLPNPSDEGRVRAHAVEIAKSVYRPLSNPPQLDELFRLTLRKAAAIKDPFEQSFFVMVHLPYLQPFADVNKRVSRLAANLPLIKANLCPLTFLDVPESAYNRAMLGVYEMTRVELLRDVYVWAYERSTQEYLAIQQRLAEPDPLRLAWRAVVKDAVRDAVLDPRADAAAATARLVVRRVPAKARADVHALVLEELRRLHEGVLARYGLRPSEYAAWKMRQTG